MPASIRESSLTRSSSFSTCERDGLAVVLADADVQVGEARDLRQVGDDEHLAGRGEPRQAPTDREPRLTADPRVDLVEHQRRDVVEIGQDASAREHHARELAPAGRLARAATSVGDAPPWNRSSIRSIPSGPGSVPPSTDSSMAAPGIPSRSSWAVEGRRQLGRDGSPDGVDLRRRAPRRPARPGRPRSVMAPSRSSAVRSASSRLAPSRGTRGPRRRSPRTSAAGPSERRSVRGPPGAARDRRHAFAVGAELARELARSRPRACAARDRAAAPASGSSGGVAVDAARGRRRSVARTALVRERRGSRRRPAPAAARRGRAGPPRLAAPRSLADAGATASISRTWYVEQIEHRAPDRVAASSSAAELAPALAAWSRRRIGTRRPTRPCAGPAYRSRNAVWVAASRSRSDWCCPWISTSRTPSSAERGRGRQLPADPGARPRRRRATVRPG